MKVYLINLDKDVKKLRFMENQLWNLGVGYERMPAINGKELAPDIKRSVVNYFRWWCAVGLPPRDAEIGCALSHYSIYKRLVSAKDMNSCCILEDDVLLTDKFLYALEKVERWIGVDAPRVVLLSDRIGRFMGKNCGNGMLRQSKFAYCTDAYVLNQLAALTLQKENFPLQRPCDHWGKWVKRGAIELYHYLPSVAVQDQETFGSSTQGGITLVRDYSLPRWIWHKGKRVIGKGIDVVLG